MRGHPTPRTAVNVNRVSLVCARNGGLGRGPSHGAVSLLSVRRYISTVESGSSAEIVVNHQSSRLGDRSKFADDDEVQAARIALDRADVGVVVIDADLRFVFANEVAATINGRSTSEHIGASIFEFLSGTEVDSIAPMLREVMRSGVAVLGLEIVGETSARPGELRVWIGDYLPHQVSGANSDDAANAVLVVFSEVTETRRAERRLRQVIDGLFAFVGLCDVDGTLLEVNEFALGVAGLESVDVVGRPFWDCYWWSHDEVVQDLVREAVMQAAAGTRCRFDVPVRVSGGRIIPIEFHLVPVIEHGRVISLVPSGIDIEVRETHLNDMTELAELAADLQVALGMNEFVKMIVGRASGLFGTSLVTLAIIDAHDNSMRVTSAAELDRSIADRWATISSEGPRTPFHDAAETVEAVWLCDPEQRRARYPEMAADSDRAGLVATAALPLVDETGVIGVLGLGWASSIGDDQALRVQAALFANLCAQALHRVNRTHSAMELLNRLTSELLARRDDAERLDVAVGYVPAESDIGFGGDWYDIVSLSETSTALIVGDVVGHNVAAAARMAVTKSALRTAVLALPDLVGVSNLVNRSIGLTQPEFFATAVVVVVDIDRHELRWKSFGHLPALLRAPDGSVVRLNETGPPIGLLVDTTPTGTIAYEPGSVIVLYTDGLIETRTDPINKRIDQLADTLASLSSMVAPSELVQSLMASVAPETPDDDIAIIVAALP